MVCVAVATDNCLEVKKGHFGDARFYAHYSWDPRRKTWNLVRLAENPYAGEHEGEEKGKRPRICEMNRECDFIVATFFGPGGREFMESRGLKVVQVKPGTSVLDALKLVLDLVSE